MRSWSPSANTPARGPAAFGRLRQGLAAGLAMLSCAAWSFPSWGAPEGEWELAGSAGASAIRADRRWAPGWEVGAEAQRGLSELWSLRLALSGSWHPVEADIGRRAGRVQAVLGAVGVVYALDIFRVVPFGELSLAALDLSQAVRAPDGYVGVEAAVGLTYHLDPRWSVTGVLRYDHLLVPLEGDSQPGVLPIIVRLMVRLCRQL